VSNLVDSCKGWRLPTKGEISPTGGLDLDEKVAVANFLGKSMASALELFRQNDVYYSNDLLHMGQYGFQYYFIPFAAYILNDEANADTLKSLAELLKFRMECCPGSLSGSRDIIISVLQKIIQSYDRFNVHEGIYGNLRDELRVILRHLTNSLE
jgi:hypothetical protein